MRQLGGSIPVEHIRRLKLEANQRLLGDTIAISDADWQGPSLLPGWTRAHVATHIARNADLLIRFTTAILHGEPEPHNDPVDDFRALEAGADRTGVDLQIDLDSTAGGLASLWDTVTDWHRPVHVDGRIQPLAVLPLARLHEVCLHHLDLDCGLGVDQVDPETASWLLAWAHAHVSEQGRSVQLESDSGQTGTIGAGLATVTVRGTDARLWAWLAGRGGPETVEGAQGIRFPLLS
ncbi:MAG: maleylpyruvate isomerase family mycothiol-dependent enzyme [Propionibacteriaceae bacterium]|nr:maleylpyruvate isomerase family mycothiol-dependent enzyme [Propionibacteriaceae bacterium]